MKILVVSLLRFGDILLSTPVLRGLREKHPQAQIDVLINKQFSSLAPLIPDADKFHFFDRGAIQKGLGDGREPLFGSYERLTALVDDLNDESYDIAINLTQNKLSGWLMYLLKAKEKRGLAFTEEGRVSYGSSWFRYLNDHAEDDGEDVFHYIDVFRFGAGLDLKPTNFSLQETTLGRDEANILLPDKKNEQFIIVQPLTSDLKKNWELSSFVKMIELFSAQNPHVLILILAAPDERSLLEAVVVKMAAAGIRTKLAVCGLEGAYSLLRRARALVTGDTGIKHLASAAKTPIIELSLGSSDYHRTGAYAQGSVIIQSKEVCAPCIHSKPCHREKHFCGSRIAPEAVAMVLNQILHGSRHQLRTIAEEYQDDIEVLVTEIKSSGFWAAYSVLEPFTESSVGRWLDLCSWKLYLQNLERGSEKDRIGEYGSEGLLLTGLLQRIYPEATTHEWRHLLSEFERQADRVQLRVHSFQSGLRSLSATYQDPQRMHEFVRGLISFRETMKAAPLLKSFKSSLDLVIEDDVTAPFQRFRRIVSALQEINQRTQIELKMIRTLQNQLEMQI